MSRRSAPVKVTRSRRGERTSTAATSTARNRGGSRRTHCFVTTLVSSRCSSGRIPAGQAHRVGEADHTGIDHPAGEAGRIHALCLASTRQAATTALATSPQRGSVLRSEEHTSELQSLMRSSYAVFCLKKKTYTEE